MWLPDVGPVLTDPALAPHAAAAAALCPGGRWLRTLRHVPGRRAAGLVDLPAGPAVLKVYAGPRARGNVRRLRLLATGPAAAVVPRAFGVDPAGHAALLEYVAGRPLDTLRDAEFVAGCRATGEALARLHGCATPLDRRWTVADEIAGLRRSCPPRLGRLAGLGDLLAGASESGEPAADGQLVPAHRDCHPSQAVVTASGSVRWIDLDEAAIAPAGLDFGNLLAHLDRDRLLGLRPAAEVAAAAAAFAVGYGCVPAGARAWRRISLARLAGLAETRFADPAAADRLAAAV